MRAGSAEATAKAPTWIGFAPLGGPRTVPSASFYRREFSITGTPPQRAILHITALGLFECEINGRRVGEDVFAPGWTDYRKRVHYHSYDVSGHLRPGMNVIGVILGDGWYSGHVAELDRGFYGECPALLASIEDAGDVSRPAVVATDPEWQCARGPIIENDLIMGEAYDARRDLGQWSAPGYVPGPDWLPVRMMVVPEIAIERSPGPPVRRQEILAGQLLPGPADVSWASPCRRFDFGQNFTGRVRLRVRGPRGLHLQIRHAEMLHPDGTLYTENLRTARATDHYTLRGGGEAEEWEPRFTFHGFRYAELTWQRASEPLHIESVEGVVLHSDMLRTGYFECSHPALNQLASNILWGQKSNFLEVPTDCPQRDERLGWTGDAQVFVRTAVITRQNAGRQRQTFGNRKFFLLPAHIFLVERTKLSADASHFPKKTRRIPTHRHARHAAFARAKQRDLRAERIFVAIVGQLQVFDHAGRSKAGNLRETAARHANVIGVGVRGIKLRRQTDAPTFVGINRRIHVVIIFAFGIDELAEAAHVINLPHGEQVFMKGGGLEHHVFEAALLDRCKNPLGIFQRAENGRNGGGDMFAVLQYFGAVLGVMRRIRANKHCLEIVWLLLMGFLSDQSFIVCSSSNGVQ